MTDRDTLLALAERVERLDGPDRVVACLIAKAIGWRPEEGAVGSTTSAPWAWCPDFTASIDAAMTLLPVESLWRVGHDADDPSGFAAQCSYDAGEGKLGFVTGSGEAAALALLSSALRARAAEVGEP